MTMSIMRAIDITVHVSHTGGDSYGFAFSGGGDAQGTVTVGGKKNGRVRLQFHAEGGKGISKAEFLGDAEDSIVVGAANDSSCPPKPGKEFEDAGHVSGTRKKLKIDDKKSEEGNFTYVLWFRVTRLDGVVDIARCDPMIINRFD
ncbi:MAG: hypothetical protein LH470_11065 [Lysobacter sp.]|nr:hypothetical protein [Lysobacter sp.]